MHFCPHRNGRRRSRDVAYLLFQARFNKTNAAPKLASSAGRRLHARSPGTVRSRILTDLSRVVGQGLDGNRGRATSFRVRLNIRKKMR